MQVIDNHGNFKVGRGSKVKGLWLIRIPKGSSNQPIYVIALEMPYSFGICLFLFVNRTTFLLSLIGRVKLENTKFDLDFDAQ